MTRQLTYAQWIKEGESRFGNSKRATWKFKCPSCGYIASAQDWQDAGAPEGAVGFSCIGRWTNSEKKMGDKTGGPCNYTSGGLFNISPVSVEFEGKTHSFFDFAEAQ